MSKPVLLIVEDELEQQEIFEEILQENFTIIPACSGKDAIHQFNIHNQDIDLILLDINLTDMTAYDVVKEWKKISFAGIPNIIMVTAYNKTSDMIRSLTENAAFFHLGKPFSKSNLLQIIDQALSTPFFEQKTFQLNLSVFIDHWISKRNEKMLEEQFLVNTSKNDFPLDEQFLFDNNFIKSRDFFKPQKILELLENDTGYFINNSMDYSICHYGKPSLEMNFLKNSPLKHLKYFQLELDQAQLLDQADMIFLDADIDDELLKTVHKFRQHLFPWDENFEPKKTPDIYWIFNESAKREQIERLIKAGINAVFSPNQSEDQKNKFIMHQFKLKQCLEYLPRYIKKLQSQKLSFRIRWEHWLQKENSEKTLQTLRWMFKDFENSIKLLKEIDLKDPKLKDKIKQKIN